jgi:hypothetical protein
LLSAAVDPSDAIKNWPIICRKAWCALEPDKCYWFLVDFQWQQG